MFGDGRKRKEQILWTVVMFCLMGFLFTMPCLAQKAPKGKIVVAVDEPFCMTGGDPNTAVQTGALSLQYLIHEGLVRMNPDGRTIPALAKSWEVAEDWKSVKFTLNERARFHNGEPVTAEDVKFSYERAIRPELRFHKAGELKKFIDRVEVIDKHHLTIYFKLPYVGFFGWSGNFFSIVPKAYIEKVGDAEFAKHPIGAGPFRWVDYQQDVFVNAEAVPDHYRQVPFVKTVNFRFRLDPATLIAMFKADEADLIKIPVPNLPEVKNDPKFRVEWTKFNYIQALVFCDLAFPNEPSPFHDIRVRNAVSYAINRKMICERLLHGTSEPWGTILPPTHLGYDPGIKPDPYDPEKAKALLKEAGYPNGFETTFNYGILGDKIEAQAMASDLAKVGIRAKLAEYEFGTFLRYFREKKFRGLFRNITSGGWGMTDDPCSGLELILSPASVWNYYTKPEFVAAHKKICEQVGEKNILAATKEAVQMYRNSKYRIPLWGSHIPWGLSQRVESYKNIRGWQAVGGLEYLQLKD
jgi:peptide/nickel transport system substrate-binding protein